MYVSGQIINNIEHMVPRNINSYISAGVPSIRYILLALILSGVSSGRGRGRGRGRGTPKPKAKPKGKKAQPKGKKVVLKHVVGVEHEEPDFGGSDKSSESDDGSSSSSSDSSSSSSGHE